MEIDLRPKAIDISLCTQEFCPHKCKRYYTNWKPNEYWQSYIQPSLRYNAMGEIEECKSRMEE